MSDDGCGKTEIDREEKKTGFDGETTRRNFKEKETGK